MKKIFILIVMIITLLLTACGSGLINTETVETEVVVLDTYHHDAWIQPMWNGKFWNYIPYPEINRVSVFYEGGQFDIDDEEVYDKYCDSIGETVVGVFEVYIYDDGTRRYDLVGLK